MELSNKLLQVFQIRFKDFIKKSDKKIIQDGTKLAVPEEWQFLVVNFNKQSQRALIANDALIRSNVELITGIDKEMQDQVHKALLKALIRGRDIDYLKNELRNIGNGIFNEEQIQLIARHQIDAASSIVHHAVLVDAGITQAIWKHSKISRVPRQSHIDANNTVYDIDKGCKIDGKYIYPAQLPGCNCYSAPFIPGIHSKTGNKLDK